MKPLKKISSDYWRQLRLRYEKIQNVQLFGQERMDGHGLACGIIQLCKLSDAF